MEDGLAVARFLITPSFLSGCYLALKRGVNVDAALRDWGLLSGKKGGDVEDEQPSSTFSRWLAGGGSTLALSFVANKALFPVRAPVTLALTPAVARVVRGRVAGGVRRD